MRQLVSRLRGDRTARAARGKKASRADAHPRMETTRTTGSRTLLRRACAVLLAVVGYVFLLNVPHVPSDALGIAYAASGLCLAVAAWRLWWPTMR